jgi:hypothetical protein
MERDAASAAAEYMAEFRVDVQSLLTREAVEAVVSLGIRERAPVAGIAYKAFVDFAGGSGTDSATLPSRPDATISRCSTRSAR